MGTLLALASALGYGLSDFIGGIASRRAGFGRIALLGQLGGLVVTVLTAPWISHGAPGWGDLGWGALSGAGTGVAMTFLFRGIGRGAMSVVVPVSAVGGVALPVLAGTVLLGQRPAMLVWAGIVLALPALWFVAGGRVRGGGQLGGAVGDGLVASVGIAVQYLALAQATPTSGIWPVAAGRVSAVLLVVLLIHTLAAGRAAPIAGLETRLLATCSGALAALALVTYLLAVRMQLLAVAVVLSSLYPVVPVVLGVTALRETLRRSQLAGLIAALAATVLIAAA